jgi:hypothetical protein
MRLLVAEVDAVDPLCGQSPDLLVVPAIRAVDPALSTTSSSPWISLLRPVARRNQIVRLR